MQNLLEENKKLSRQETIDILNNNRDSLFKDISIDAKYYFVHSYMVQANNPVNVLMKANYGVEFDSAIGSENICGVQFHPEKSHKYGKQILKNFSEM